MGRDHRGVAGIASTLLIAAIAGTLAWAFTHFYADDAMISLRYAQRLLEGQGLTWTQGERVEGYSNLLWVLMTSGLGALGVDLLVATRVLGVAGLMGTMVLISLGPDGRPCALRALSGGAFLALSGGLALWAVGGLAQTFFSMLALAALLAIRRAHTRWGLAAMATLLATATLLRIDGVVLVAALLLASLVQGIPWRRVALVGLAPAVAWSAQQAFRVLYHQDWIPNTARVKVSFTLERALHGLAWTGDALLDHGALVLAALAAVLLLRRRALPPLIVAVLWVAYVSWVGGDLFHGWRLFLPALPMLALLVADAAPQLGRRGWVLLAMAVLVHGAWNLTRWDAYPLRHGPTWTFRTAAIARVLRRGLGDKDPLLAVDAAGALPYYTRFRAVDMLGLTDRYLPRHPPPGWGAHGLGHDLGDGDYILNRKPDIVAFRSGFGGEPRFVSGNQMAAHPDWPDHYRRSVFQARHPGRVVTGTYYIRVIDGPLAPFRSDDRILIPAYILGTDEHPVRLRDGSLGPLIPAGEAITVDFVLPPGTWSMDLQGTGPLTGSPSLHSRSGRVRFSVGAGDDQAQLTAIELTIDTTQPPSQGALVGPPVRRATIPGRPRPEVLIPPSPSATIRP
jgi:arabinofuranosyltransferase